MSGLGNRHRGDLGGRLNLGGSPVSVAVIVEDPASVAGQHTTWMLLSLLTRLGKDVVRTIFVIGRDAPLYPRVTPLAETAEFPDALIGAAVRVGDCAEVTRTTDAGSADLTLHVGPGPAPAHGWRVSGSAWQGTLTVRDGPVPAMESELPFGPYAAACLAAAEIFRHVRVPEDRRAVTEYVHVDLWDRPGVPAPADLDGLTVDFGLAGVGAVGTAALQAVWATRGLAGRAVIADNDPEGVDGTNLNRCVLFDTRHVGASKASTARDLCAYSELEIFAIDGPYDSDHLATPKPRMLLSAVDSNEARHGLQINLVPAPAVAASTHEMRAEVRAFGPPGKGPCLACGNPVLHGVPDDVHRDHVRAMTDDELAAFSQRLGLSSEDVLAWARRGDCGTISSAVLGHLNQQGNQPPMWSVGFVSVYAGVALAAEMLKEAAGHSAAGTGAKFQFMKPQSPGNGRRRSVAADATCPVCGDDVHQDVWARRWRESHNGASASKRQGSTTILGESLRPPRN